MEKELMKRRNELDEKRNRIEKIKTFLLAMLIIALIIMFSLNWAYCPCQIPCHAGIGERDLHKWVGYTNGTAIEDANVSIKHGSYKDWMATDEYGWANFSNIDKGRYKICVDIDNDGNWDGMEHVDVSDEGVTEVYNEFSPPDAWQGKGK